MRALHKDKRQRYQSARELQQALHHYMNLSRMSVSKFQAAEFLDSVLVMEESDSGPDRPMGMGREEFRADESSMIFKPGDKLIIPPLPLTTTPKSSPGPSPLPPSSGLTWGQIRLPTPRKRPSSTPVQAPRKTTPFAIPDDVLDDPLRPGLLDRQTRRGQPPRIPHKRIRHHPPRTGGSSAGTRPHAPLARPPGPRAPRVRSARQTPPGPRHLPPALLRRPQAAGGRLTRHPALSRPQDQGRHHRAAAPAAGGRGGGRP